MGARPLYNVLIALVLMVTGTVTSRAATPAATPASPGAVIAWNTIAQRAAVQVAKQFQTQSMISLAYTQAAVYDAVVAITGGYEPYGLHLARRPYASIDAADRKSVV